MRSLRVPVVLSLPFLLALAVQALGCSGPSTEAEPPKPSPPQPVVTAPAPPSAQPADTTAANAKETPSAAAQASAAPVSAPPPEDKKACPKGMALIPGGKLAMGAPKKEVTLGAICLDINEVTADDYAACVQGGQCNADHLKCAPQATFGADGKGNHPINCVDFSQATADCKAQNKRLPTNEEWEFAARGPEGRFYPWGNDAPKDQLCWTGSQVRTGTCPIAATPKGDTPQGVHDLAGNVFEWTTSKGDAKTQTRDGRGGSWKDGAPELVRSSRPGAFQVTYRCGFLGIRFAIDAPPGS